MISARGFSRGEKNEKKKQVIRARGFSVCVYIHEYIHTYKKQMISARGFSGSSSS
jgi:hypothetical protein